MSEILSITKVIQNFADYINCVAYRKEHFVLIRGNKPVAELRPVPSGKKLEDLPALLRDLPHLTEEEAVEFGKDINAARNKIAKKRLKAPWDS